jgi:NDP-sugar pyrophosphorylase family protein
LDISLRLLALAGKDVSAGADCEISPGAAVAQAVLWDNVRIASGAQVKRAVLGDNVRISDGEVVQDAAVVCAALVRDKTAPAKALKGDFRGDNFVVPLTE